MAVDPKSEEAQTLRKLFPMETMPARQYNAICSEISILEKPEGAFLFKQGDVPDVFIYLINGSISLEAEEFKIETISAGTEAAKFAIAHQFPRQISARALSNVRYVGIHLNAFDRQEIVDVEEESNYMVDDEDDLATELSDDWMSVLLKSPIFERLPAMNLQKVLMCLQDVEFKKGDIIFKQGDIGDYYYLIKKGRCALSRKASERAKEIKLLELGRNETFGEDALLSGEPRSMTITAISDMLLARIDKERFIKLIIEPALSYVDYQQLQDQCAQNLALAVDIRSIDAFKEHHIAGSLSMPFFSLRMNLKELAKQAKKIIIICENGELSKAAAFVLIKNRLEAQVLRGGMQCVSKAAESLEEAVFTIDESDAVENNSVFVAQAVDGGDDEISGQAPDTNALVLDDELNLAEENQTLRAENVRLTTELDKLKMQYRRLYAQTEKLKAAFDKLQATK